MAKLQVLVGSTSQTVNLFIQDSSSTTGAGLTGLVYNTSSLVAYYALPKAAAVSITLATLAAVTSAWSSGGFKEVDATNMPGWYRFDIPDAALASGRYVTIHLKGAANMAPLPLEIELTLVNNQSATAFMTSVATAVALTTNNDKTGYALSAGGVQAIWDALTAALTTANSIGKRLVDNITGDAFVRLGAPVGASISVDIAEIEGETDAIIATIGTPAGVSVSADIAAIRVDTNTTIPNLIAALNNISSANVKTQVVAALNTDTYAEPGQGTPAATTTLQLKISYLYKAWRNRTDQTATAYKLFNDDASTVDQKATVSDDGTTFSKTELVTGP